MRTILKFLGSGAIIQTIIFRNSRLICPLLSGPFSVLELATKEEVNGKEARAGGDHRQAA